MIEGQGRVPGFTVVENGGDGVLQHGRLWGGWPILAGAAVYSDPVPPDVLYGKSGRIAPPNWHRTRLEACHMDKN